MLVINYCYSFGRFSILESTNKNVYYNFNWDENEIMKGIDETFNCTFSFYDAIWKNFMGVCESSSKRVEYIHIGIKPEDREWPIDNSSGLRTFEHETIKSLDEFKRYTGIANNVIGKIIKKMHYKPLIELNQLVSFYKNECIFKQYKEKNNTDTVILGKAVPLLMTEDTPMLENDANEISTFKSLTTDGKVYKTLLNTFSLQIERFDNTATAKREAEEEEGEIKEENKKLKDE